jgi:hypothetical protein
MHFLNAGGAEVRADDVEAGGRRARVFRFATFGDAAPQTVRLDYEDAEFGATRKSNRRMPLWKIERAARLQ